MILVITQKSYTEFKFVKSSEEILFSMDIFVMVLFFWGHPVLSKMLAERDQPKEGTLSTLRTKKKAAMAYLRYGPICYRNPLTYKSVSDVK